MTTPELQERQVRALVEAGQLSQAATLALDMYGPELMRFLALQLGDDADADDAFGQTCADLWGGLAGFLWRASLRTWMYTLAKNAASRLRRSAHQRPGRHVPISELSEAVERVRSQTALHLRTEAKDLFATIRAQLDPEDRALLLLRVDRELDWKDIAHVLFPEEAARSPQELARVTARLRKRFQAVKAEVRRRATDAGLLTD
jgi:RNA polymerase sigma-70 factor (ECF subfamily)